MSYPLIMEPGQLDSLLGEPGLLIVDLCKDALYEQAHLPGALHVRPGEMILGEEPAVGKIAPPDRLAALYSRLGIDQARHIVAYDDEGGGWAGRFLWTLHVTGYRNYSYLNGGFIAWRDEQRTLETVASRPSPGKVEVSIDWPEIAQREDVLAAVARADHVIWDARSAEEYHGQRQFAQRGGHVPGAVNLDWLHTMDPDRSLRIRSNVRELMAAAGISGEKPIITYCQTHHRSGLTWLLGMALGYPIKAYHGAWSEWGNDSALPVESA